MLLKKFKNRFLIQKYEKNFIDFAKKKFIKNNKTNGSILIEAPLDDKFFLIKNFMISTYLSKKFNLDILYYINFNKNRSFRSAISKVYYLLVYNFISFNKLKKIYDAFCNKMVLNCYYVGNKKNNLDKNISFRKILNFQHKGVKIGDLILDSYLYYFYNFRYYGDIKKCINEKLFQRHFQNSLNIVGKFHELFEKENIKILINNYSGYLDHGIAARFAEKYNLPIYYICEIDRPFIKSYLSKHKRNYRTYKNNFLKLNEKQKKINKSLKILNKRFLGRIDFGINYLKKNNYKKTNKKVIENQKKSICIFLHNTTDSLFGFSFMNFTSQNEWIVKTLKLLKFLKNDYNILVKIHPNETIEGEDFLRSSLPKFTYVKIIDKNINIKTIINSKLVAGITLHGSVGLELAYHNIPTIYGNDNPYVAFDFCIKSNNIPMYKKNIQNIKFLSKKKIYKKEAAIFYHMNFIQNHDGKVSNYDQTNLISYLNKGKELSDKNFQRYINYLKNKKLSKIYEYLNKSDKSFDNF